MGGQDLGHAPLWYVFLSVLRVVMRRFSAPLGGGFAEREQTRAAILPVACGVSCLG